ncbi:MAG TPA: bacillithiol system redox-active protein YtxJ [Pyrinomonadaceae bacterium]|nr:bacillithiol system redox-active protein YtxJ [Pyrinomonadaceae bacterium]
MSSKGFVEIEDVESLERFISEAGENPAIVFKHSNTCGISARVYREMSQVDRPVGIIIVQQAREVSDEIARRFGVQHETPQALLVRGDRVLWSASHYGVKAQAIEEALNSVSSEQ